MAMRSARSNSLVAEGRVAARNEVITCVACGASAIASAIPTRSAPMCEAPLRHQGVLQVFGTSNELFIGRPDRDQSYRCRRAGHRPRHWRLRQPSHRAPGRPNARDLTCSQYAGGCCERLLDESIEAIIETFSRPFLAAHRCES